MWVLQGVNERSNVGIDQTDAGPKESNCAQSEEEAVAK